MANETISIEREWLRIKSIIARGAVREAEAELIKLIARHPTLPFFYEQLAKLYNALGQGDQAIKIHRDLTHAVPTYADGHFNYAYALKQAGQYEEALSSYETALEHNIKGAEEVYTNMAALCSDGLNAPEMALYFLGKALEVNPRYIPALFNLANLHEQQNNRDAAIQGFRSVLSIDPRYYLALARIADLKTFDEAQDPDILAIKRALKFGGLDGQIRTDLLFGLGKALDDCASYQEAFDAYRQANSLASQKMHPYDPGLQEKRTDTLIRHFGEDWMKRNRSGRKESPIFICGMFRSGSTLTEQILAAHPDVIAGGEREFFPRLISGRLSPFPVQLANMKASDFDSLANQYLQETRNLFSPDKIVTDKRPDNFILVGLIKTLFPNARIIWTRRQRLDNMLSAYFMQLGPAMNYATNPENILHYYDQSEKLLDHFQKLYKDSIYIADYDRLVRDPKTQIEALINFCGLPWHDGCLDFHKVKNRVMTGSSVQVRKPLYAGSSGRWRNYEAQLRSLALTE